MDGVKGILSVETKMSENISDRRIDKLLRKSSTQIKLHSAATTDQTFNDTSTLQHNIAAQLMNQKKKYGQLIWNILFY